MLLHDGGKPLVLRVDATHADLLAMAGPGKYRLEAVDELRRRVDGVPHACTGPLSEDDDGPGDDDGDHAVSGPPARRARLEDVVCQLLANQTRMVETTIGQLGTVIAGVADLIQAAHQSGITSRSPGPAPLASVPPPPAPPPVDEDEDDEEEAHDDEDESDEETTANAAPPSMLPEALRLIIEKAVDKLVPLIVEKIASGELLSGIPLGALLDWRKAAPAAVMAPPSAPSAPTSWGPAASAAAVPSAPTAWPPTPAAWSATAAAPNSATVPSPAAPTSWGPAAAAPRAAMPMTAAAVPAMPTDVGVWAASPGPGMPGTSTVPVVPGALIMSEPAHGAQGMTAPPSETAALAGAAPSPAPQLGVAPAEAPRNAAAAAGAPMTQPDAAAALNAHILQIWRGLSPPERGRATQLIMGLSDAERAAWLAELARLSVPEAIARARAVMAAPPANAPPTHSPTPSASKE
jgi:hypothetical protein